MHRAQRKKTLVLCRRLDTDEFLTFFYDRIFLATFTAKNTLWFIHFLAPRLPKYRKSYFTARVVAMPPPPHPPADYHLQAALSQAQRRAPVAAPDPTQHTPPHGRSWVNPGRPDGPVRCQWDRSP